MKIEWILVASREEARIFSRSGVGPLTLVCDLGNPTGALKLQDLESDSPGRSTDNRMHARHSYSTQESSKERAIRSFYREVIDRLERGFFEHHFDNVTLIAEPKLLGIIRALVPDSLKTTIHREIAKDLSYEGDKQILARLEAT
jgi:protein required for attachment to host cells